LAGEGFTLSLFICFTLKRDRASPYFKHTIAHSLALSRREWLGCAAAAFADALFFVLWFVFGAFGKNNKY